MRPRRYQIIVSGQLSEIGGERLGDLRIERYGTETALTGELDQPGLGGVIERIRMSDLELKESSPLEEETGSGRPPANLRTITEPAFPVTSVARESVPRGSSSVPVLGYAVRKENGNGEQDGGLGDLQR